jgi:hypothetical protein
MLIALDPTRQRFEFVVRRLSAVLWLAMRPLFVVAFVTDIDELAVGLQPEKRERSGER